jgi:hypothetical protein
MKREGRSFSDRLKGLGEPPAGSLYSTVLDQSEEVLLQANVNPNLVA